jgi:hypothetical protein
VDYAALEVRLITLRGLIAISLIAATFACRICICSWRRASQSAAAARQAQRQMPPEDLGRALAMAPNPLLLELARTLDRNQQIPRNAERDKPGVHNKFVEVTWPDGKLLPVALAEKNSDLPKNSAGTCFIMLDGNCGP